MPNPAPGSAAHPDHRVDLVPEPRRLKVVFAGVTIADSASTLRVEETGHGPVHYFPPKDVRTDLLRPSERHTRCPFKGEASYWTIAAPGKTAEDAVWAYPEPYDEVAGLAGYFAFYGNRVDSIEPA